MYQRFGMDFPPNTIKNSIQITGGRNRLKKFNNNIQRENLIEIRSLNETNIQNIRDTNQ